MTGSIMTDAAIVGLVALFLSVIVPRIWRLFVVLVIALTPYGIIASMLFCRDVYRATRQHMGKQDGEQ